MENFLHNLILNRCYLCDIKGQIICENCLKKFRPYTNSSKDVYSFFEYNDYSKKVLYLSKYPPYYFVLLKFLTIYALKTQRNSLLNFLNISINRKFILCPIPLSWSRIYERRFNQAEVISMEIQKDLKIPSFNILKRIKDTAPLYDLDKFQRRKELDNAFKTSILFKFLRLFNIKKVILVDDLVTTSQTFTVSSKLLKYKGISEVILITLFSKK